MEKIKRKSGLRYREMIYINGQLFKSPVFKRKTDAKEWKKQKEIERSQLSIYGHISKPNLKLEEFIDEWLEIKVKNKNSMRTFETYHSDIKNHIKPILGKVGIGYIGIDKADLLVSSLKAKGLSNRTINKVMSCLKTIINDAVSYQYIPRSQLVSYKELKVQDKPEKIFTEMEIHRLIDANKNEKYLAPILFALNLGTRLGETLGLQFDRVSVSSNTVEITRTLTRKGLQEVTKTSKKRSLPMNKVVRSLIEKQISEQQNPTWVFTDDKGEPFDVNHFTQRFVKKALRKAGLDESFNFHSCRHTMASHFMMNGGNIYTLQKLLGHSDISMTQRYSHLSKNFLEESASIVEFGGDFTVCTSVNELRLV